MSVVRRIEGSIMVNGLAVIEYATHDKVPVLKVRFTQAGKHYEETCIIGSDLDNYARITCHLYTPDKTTNRSGMETYFINFDKPS